MYNRGTREKTSYALSILSHPRAVEGDRKKHGDDSWTMRGLRAWLAHVFRLQGQTGKVLKRRCLWATAVPVFPTANVVRWITKQPRSGKIK